MASEEDEDDSFTYGAARLKKNEAKKRKIKAKLGGVDRKGKLKRDDSKKDRPDNCDLEYVDYVYAGVTKNKVELKIFNPELHETNYI